MNQLPIFNIYNSTLNFNFRTSEAEPSVINIDEYGSNLLDSQYLEQIAIQSLVRLGKDLNSVQSIRKRNKNDLYKSDSKKLKGTNKCGNCKATETPQWRSGPAGKERLCNACGLIYQKQVKNLREAQQNEWTSESSPE